MKKLISRVKNCFNQNDSDRLSKDLTKKLIDTDNVDDFFIEEVSGDKYIPIPEEINDLGDQGVLEWYHSIFYTKIIKDFKGIGINDHDEDDLIYLKNFYDVYKKYIS